MITLTHTNSYRGGTISLDVELPALTGSDKQVAWALDLREKALKAALEKLIEAPDAIAKLPAMRARGLFEALRAEVETRTEARVWIDERGATAGLLLLRAATKRLASTPKETTP